MTQGFNMTTACFPAVRTRLFSKREALRALRRSSLTCTFSLILSLMSYSSVSMRRAHGPAAKCSAIGPRTATGRNSSAPMKTTLPRITIPNRGVSVRRVPVVSGAGFFAAKEPAMAKGRMIGMKRASSMIDAGRHIPGHGVVAQALEARSVVGRRGTELIKDFRKPVRARDCAPSRLPMASSRRGPFRPR